MPPERSKKSFLKRWLSRPKVLAFLLLIVIILISLPLAKNISRRHKINNEIKQVEKEIAEIENKDTDLEKLIKYLDSSQFAEEQGRLNLGFKKEGEEVVVVKDNSGDQGERAVTSAPNNAIFNIPGLVEPASAKSLNNPGRWWRYFFK